MLSYVPSPALRAGSLTTFLTTSALRATSFGGLGSKQPGERLREPLRGRSASR